MDKPFTIREGPYLSDILEQPAAVRRTLDALESHAPTEAIQKLGAERGFDRVVLTGMGSSFHALHPLAIRLNATGLAVQMIETSELLHYYRAALGPRALLVAVSQSGESGELVHLLRERTHGGPVIGITNTAGSTLEREATIAIVTAAGTEATVSCKTYLAVLQALHWVGAALAGDDMARVRKELVQAQVGVELYLADWRAHVAWLAGGLDGVRRVFFTGRGWSLATAGTAGLILKESTRFSAEGMSAAAFRHGPVETWADGGSVLMWICEGAPVTAELNRKLYADAVRAGVRAWLVGSDAAAAALRIPACAPELLPMMEILPVQMLTLALAARLGMEAGHFSVAAKVTSVE